MKDQRLMAQLRTAKQEVANLRKAWELAEEENKALKAEVELLRSQALPRLPAYEEVP